MPQQSLRRVVDTWTFVENSEHTFDIPRIQNIEAIMLELDCTVNLTTGGSSVRSEAAARLIDKVQFIAGGKDVLDDINFDVAVFGDYKRGFKQSSTPPSAATAASYNVRAVAMLDRNNVNGWRPHDTAFKAWLTKLLQVRITTKAATDLFTGSPAGSVTGGTVKLSVLSHDEVNKGDGLNALDEPKRVIKRTTQLISYTSANSSHQVELPIGNACKQITLHCLDDEEPSNALVNNAQLSINDVDVRVNLPYDQIRDINAKDRGLSLSQVPDGFAVIDSSPRGKFFDYYDFRGTPDNPVTRALLTLDLAAPSGQGLIAVVVEEDIS